MWSEIPLEMDPVSAEYLLPMEVWGKIFQHSAAKDAWNFRLVCSPWRKELDDHYDKWTLRLDQKSPYFQNFLELKVKKATIWDLSTPEDMGQEGTPRLFKHPELLEKLSIPKDSQICLVNMMLLLNSCGKTIKHLDLAAGRMDEDDEKFDTANNLFPTGIEFTNLESLKLYFPSCRAAQELTLLKVMVELSTMSKIRSLIVLVSDFLCSNVPFSTILAFIAKNGTNLEVIECHLDPQYSEDEDSDDEDEEDEEPVQAQLPANSIDLALLRQVRRLQKVEIHYYGNSFNESLQIPCETLLEAQKNLTHLNLIGILISRQSLRRVCYNNQNTLTEIYLCDLDFDIELGILAGCMHLKELLLFSGDDSQDCPAIQNARSLPVGIQKFESENYFIESEDILNLFTGHGELVNVSLHNSGSDGLNGMTAAVFALFVINQNLSNKLKDVYIDGFNCSTAGDLAALNEIVRGLEPAWEDRQDFRNVKICMERTMGEGGDWSVWETSTYDD